MAKDPAVLFYTNDFLTGTFTMSNEEVGAYIRLLCLQHQKGSLSSKDFESICKLEMPEVVQKFVKTEEGTFYNVRMREEALKRENFSNSRSKNRKNKKSSSSEEHMNSICKSYDVHMENENENENINKDVNSKVVSNKSTTNKFIPPTYEEVLEYAKEKGREDLAKEYFEYFDTGQWVDSKGEKVKNWKQKFLTWCSRNPKKVEPEKPRYGDFDIDEAFMRALQRSDEQFDLMEG